MNTANPELPLSRDCRHVTMHQWEQVQAKAKGLALIVSAPPPQLTSHSQVLTDWARQIAHARLPGARVTNNDGALVEAILLTTPPGWVADWKHGLACAAEVLESLNTMANHCKQASDSFERAP